MEVHAHTHTARKKWTHYLWEFLMLFLAVFCGFLAEYQLEHTIENQREKKYILSMIEDAQTDTANIQAAIVLNKKRILSLDSMANDCFNYSNAGVTDSVLYHFLPKCWRHPDFASPTERTMFQLKNAGGMRLIRKKVAADSIIAYDDFGKKLLNQQAYYERYLNEIVDGATSVFNFKYFPMDMVKYRTMTNEKDLRSAKLLTSDKVKIIEFGNKASLHRGIVGFYLFRLEEGKQHALNLIETLKKEYHLI